MRNVNPAWMKVMDVYRIGVVGHNFFCNTQIPKFWIMYKRNKATTTALIKHNKLSKLEGSNPFKFYVIEYRKHAMGPNRYRDCPDYLRARYYTMGGYYGIHAKSIGGY